MIGERESNILALADLREQVEKQHRKLEGRIIVAERGVPELRAQMKQMVEDKESNARSES